MPINCVIHPWMRGYLLLRDNPYMAKSDADGRFRIENLPVGEHEFQLWHERAGYLRDVAVGATTADRRGRLTVTIEPAENDLGEVVLDEELFSAAD